MTTKSYREAKHGPAGGASVLLCAALILLFSAARPGHADDEAPALFEDFGDRPHNEESGETYVITSPGESITQYAIGGKSDGPGPDLGRPPWTKTGNVRYVWYVEGDSGIESVADGDMTNEPSSEWFLDLGGSCTISAVYQTEYQDSSDPPARIYWPR